MITLMEAIFGGFISKVINDVGDATKEKIIDAVKNKNSKHQNLESQIYNIIVSVLNKITYNQYENDQDKIYDVAENLLKSFKENDSDYQVNLKTCLQISCSDADGNKCKEFKIFLYEELGKEEHSELFRAILLLVLERKNQYDNDVYEQLNKKLDEVILNQKKGSSESRSIHQKIKSRTQEYADKWNANMFLNDFDEWDEKAGVNVKLSDVYLKEHLPHFIWGENENKSTDLKKILTQYIEEKNENKMLLIFGQPGIGKSTLITWITANFSDRIDDILVYKFASDFKNIDWEKSNVHLDILEALNLSYDDLERKTLILDGFDEISIGADRREVLDNLYGGLIYNNINNFSLIITCRENYIQGFEKVKCRYIHLQPWDDMQIQSFCNIFQEKTKNKISEDTIEKLVENEQIFGIPLILYMVLALNIAFENNGSIVDVYDKIFALEGGIYDRCIDNKKFAESHRISEMKMQIHQISREIAMWMFENNPDEAYIPQKEYKKICAKIIQEAGEKKSDIEKDFIIGNFFGLKHCEGEEELYFVHRSIYEYFVVETIYSSIENSMRVLSEESQEELASSIAIYLKLGEITYTVGEYLLCKICGLFNELSVEKQNRFYVWWEETVDKMMEKGMFYYTNKNINYYENIISKECQCFKNIFIILRLFLTMCNEKYVMGNINRELLEKYIKYCLTEVRFKSIDNTPTDLVKLDFNYMDLHEMNLIEIELKKVYLNHTNLSGANLIGVNLKGKSLIDVDLTKANLSEANLREADLSYANLREANLREADLSYAILKKVKLINADLENTNLSGADLSGADLRGTNLVKVNLQGANLKGTIFNANHITYLEYIYKYNFENARVYISSTQEIINYSDYCKRNALKEI